MAVPPLGLDLRGPSGLLLADSGLHLRERLPAICSERFYVRRRGVACVGPRLGGVRATTCVFVLHRSRAVNGLMGCGPNKTGLVTWAEDLRCLPGGM